MLDNRPIGIFDSGMGGISVLGEAIRQMPNETFIYFGDSANAPYGEKSTDQIIDLSDRVCERLKSHDVKAIVIACNTATSAAAAYLREKFAPIPILGMEPALKPAVQDHPHGDIVVMATEVTLREKKFAALMQRTAAQANVIKLEIKSCFQEVDTDGVDAVVLGCTHFIFLRKALRTLFGDKLQIYDGNAGTINNLKMTLDQMGMLAHPENKGGFTLLNSKNDAYNLQMQNLLDLYEQVVI
jgi:glutamate racemase